MLANPRARLRLAVLGATGFLLLCGTGILSAATTPVTYTGCLNKTTGIPYNVAAAGQPLHACLGSDPVISWNNIGPQGATGAVGPAGPAGSKGATGATGATGAAGPVGPAGPKGATGAAGATGATGAAGATGATGPAGAAGAAGPQGLKGDTGATGTAGANGKDGAPGADGKDGVSPTVSTERVGANCTYGGYAVTDATHTVYACNGAPGAKGDTGAKGDPGATGPQGPAGPASLDALNGTPCTFNGETATVVVSVDSATGAVSLVCRPTTNPRLTVKFAGGDGRVQSSPTGLDCTSDCTHSFTFGQTVTLSAQDGSHSFFDNWGGDCSGPTCTLVNLTSDKTVWAYFTPASTLDLTLTPGSQSSPTFSVTISPVGAQCTYGTGGSGGEPGGHCQYFVRSGSQLSLAASADVAWHGVDATYGSRNAMVVMTSIGRTVTADYVGP